MTTPENPDPTEPGEGSRRGALIALLFIAVLTLGGYWIFHEMERHNEIDNCIASGRRNCTGDLLHPDATTP